MPQEIPSYKTLLPPECIRENCMGPNPLPMLEELLSAAPLPPGGIIPLRDLERNAILDAVRRCGDDTPGKKAAAAALGIGVATLYRKLKEYEDEAAALSRTT